MAVRCCLPARGNHHPVHRQTTGTAVGAGNADKLLEPLLAVDGCQRPHRDDLVRRLLIRRLVGISVGGRCCWHRDGAALRRHVNHHDLRWLRTQADASVHFVHHFD